MQFEKMQFHRLDLKHKSLKLSYLCNLPTKDPGRENLYQDIHCWVEMNTEFCIKNILCFHWERMFQINSSSYFSQDLVIKIWLAILQIWNVCLSEKSSNSVFLQSSLWKHYLPYSNSVSQLPYLPFQFQ